MSGVSDSVRPESPTELISNGHSNGYLRRIPVKENSKIVLVDTEQVIWLESYGNYIFLHTDNGKHIYRETMSAMEKKLDPSRFVASGDRQLFGSTRVG